jgi:hypothetical protein
MAGQDVTPPRRHSGGRAGRPGGRGAGGRRSRLTELADWITWLRATYRIPATVIPPCWFTQPGIREDIGHMWTGWLLTRDAGVGMIGLDWDQRKDAAINRLREATAVTGCTATRHQPEPEPAKSATSAVDQLWRDHLDTQTNQPARGLRDRGDTFNSSPGWSTRSPCYDLHFASSAL